jgi:hypothetical protein
MKSLKIFLVITVLGVFTISAIGQTEKPKPYNPMADAKEDIAQALKKAKAENKHVFIQVGGNW